MNKTFKIETVRMVTQKADTAEQAIKRAKRKGRISSQAIIRSVKQLSI